MSQLPAVPEHRSCESPFEQQLSGLSSFEDGSPKRSAPKRASSSGRPVQRQLSIDSQMSASIRKMTPAELPNSRSVFSHINLAISAILAKQFLLIHFMYGTSDSVGI